VKVERGGAWGRFTQNGDWLEGEIRYADPTFCRWVTSAEIAAEWRRAVEPAARKSAKKKSGAKKSPARKRK
jgi:hypothetical protein